MKVLFLLLAFSALAFGQDDTYPQEGINNVTLITRDVSYTDSTGASLQGYFAYDSAISDPRGLVVILPDWDGIGNYERWRAQLLASIGYAAFVADIYTTAVPQGPSLPQANRSQLSGTYSRNQTLYVARIVGAIAAAKTDPVVDPTRVAAIGYCFGGGGVIQLARAYGQPGTEGLLGVVSFHGSQLAYKAGDKNFTMGNPVVVSIQNGYLDPSNNASQLASIQAELEAAQITYQFTNYGKTVHAFTEPNLAPWTPATTGTQAYSRYSDVASWWSLRALLLDIFGAVEGASNPYTASTGVWDYYSDFVAYS